MHISDGVLPLEVVVVTTGLASVLIIYSLKSLKEEEIPKISLLTATFFVLSLISIPIGPTSIHPLLCAILGIILGWRSTLAVFVGLLLHAIIFQHGGLTTLGANTLLVSIPALLSHLLFKQLRNKVSRISLLSTMIGGFAVFLTVGLLILILIASSPYFYEGTFSVIRLLLIGYLPLVFIEGIITGFVIKILMQVRPSFITGIST